MATGQTKNKSGNFLVQGSILAIAGIIVRLIGLAYRIPLIRIIGDEGMGYYSVAFEVYSVILLLSSYSLPLAVSKMVSAKIAEDDYLNADRIFKVSLIYATIVGFVGCIFVWLSADWFANVFYKLPLCKYALISLAPTIWIAAYLGVLRGYYQGRSTMVPTAVSQIFEQIVNAFVSVGAAWWLCDMALKAAKGESVASAWGAAGGTIGTGAGALAALIILIVLFIKGRKEWRLRVDSSVAIGVNADKYRDISKILLLTAIPVILSSVVNNLTGIIDAEIFSSTMVSDFGINPSIAAANYGVFTGKFKTLANIPIAIANALSSSIIVVMSTAVVENNKKGVQDAITLSLRFTILIALPASVGLAVLGDPIISLLFGKSDLAVSIMTLGAAGIFFNSIATVSNSILQGNSYMRIPVINLIISLVIHVVFLLIMLKVFNLGIYGVVYAYDLFGLCIYVLNAISMKNRIGYKSEVMITYIKPLICAAVMGIAAFLMLKLTRIVTTSNFIITFICMAISVLVYVVMVVITGTVTKDELKRFPVIKRFIK